MLQRLVEAHYLKHRGSATEDRQAFWGTELRTPELLIEFAQTWPETARRLIGTRPLLILAIQGKTLELNDALQNEESVERERDRVYWQPLKAELEQLRHAAIKPPN